MSELPFTRSYKDLIVCRKAREVSKRVFDLSKSFPLEEKYSLTDQVRRSVRSIGGQIAEAWAKRTAQSTEPVSHGVGSLPVYPAGA